MFYFSFNCLLIRGSRIALRNKVNESCLFGITIIDSILPVGQGQRQLILGDRYTGKTSIFLFLLFYYYFIFNKNLSIDGFCINRLIGIYIGISQNLTKIKTIIYKFINLFILCILSLTSDSCLLSFYLPLFGLSICERLRDRGNNIILCFDDFSKHSKCYRQISLILGKIPSRDAFPSDIFNIHSSLLERCGKLSIFVGGSGSISAFPIIETINSDITEYIATNIISITDGQFYTNKQLFLNSIRPAIDSALSVSRIGSNAQSK